MDENEDARLGVHKHEDRAMNENDDDKFNHVDDEESLSPAMDFALTKLASRLCAICQNLCQGEVKVLEYWENTGSQLTGEREHHLSLSSLRESVNAGCPLCKELAQYLEERFDEEPQVRDSVADSWYITCLLERKGWWWSSGKDGLCFRFYFYQYDRSNPCSYPGLHWIIYPSFYPAEKLGLGPEYSGERNTGINSFAQANQCRICRWSRQRGVFTKYWPSPALVQHVLG